MHAIAAASTAAITSWPRARTTNARTTSTGTIMATTGEDNPPSTMNASRQPHPLPSSFHTATASSSSVVHQNAYRGNPKTSGSDGTRKTARAHQAGARNIVGLLAMATPTATITVHVASVLTNG